MGSRHTKREQKLWDQVTVAALSAPWFAGTLNELHEAEATSTLAIHELAALIADGVIVARRARSNGAASVPTGAPQSVPPAAPWSESPDCLGDVAGAVPGACTGASGAEVSMGDALVPEELVGIVERESAAGEAQST